MSASKKQYHLMPRLDCPPPPDGPIDVGQLFAEPHDLTTHLDSVEKYQRPGDSDIYTHKLTDYALAISSAKNGKAGIRAKLLDNKALGGELGGIFDDSKDGNYKFDTLTTRFIHPDNEYITTAINQEGVKQFLKHGKVVYMLQGLKIAEVASFRNTDTRAGEVHGHVGSSGNGPVEVGAEVEAGAKRSISQSFRSTSFVFAYSMLKIKCRQNKDSSVIVKKRAPVGGGFLEAGGAAGSGTPKPVYEVESMEQDNTERSILDSCFGPPREEVEWELDSAIEVILG
jgi:hypothetical protein